jgi:hypothetical protein
MKSIISIFFITSLILLLLLGYGCINTQTNPSPQSSPVENGSHAPNEGESTFSSTVDLTDRDHDGVTDALEDQAITKFAPIIKFHINEKYLLANIPWYLRRVRMRFDVSHGFDDQLIDKENLTMANLLSLQHKGQLSGLSAKGSDFFLEQTDAVGGDDLDNYRLDTRKGTAQTTWVIYAHVRPVPVQTLTVVYDIQYIFFFAYNSDMLKTVAESAHEADFEHITVRIEGDLGSIHKIYYSAHDAEGKWYDIESRAGAFDGYELSNSGRPIVYCAINSHASYPWSGIWSRNNLPDDETGDNGIEWDCQNSVVNVGEKQYPTEGNEWIQYSGRWGELGEIGFTKGPYGPAYQPWWNCDLE